ncbi:MAG: HEPN domain-containing protein [bacterium]|nr:HEPN domain-containing protein [bacterium]
MKLKEKVDYWLDIAQYDMETASAMQKSKRFLYTIFMCQQGLEKTLKAIHLQGFAKEAPPSHNLIYLVNLLNVKPKDLFLELMAELTTYYIEGRYPTYKQKLSVLVDKRMADRILKESMEVYEWLKSLLK